MKNLKPTTKALLCRISAGAISAGVPIAAVASQFDFFLQRSEYTVSAVALIALIVGAVSFKDSVFKALKTPSALKIWIIIFGLAVIANQIAYQFMVVSAFGLAAQGASFPLEMLDKKYKLKAEEAANELRNFTE